MTFYLRYSQNIEKDIQNEISFHYTGLDKNYMKTAKEVAETFNIDIDSVIFNEEARQWVQKLQGLCAFELEADNLEDAIEEAVEYEYNDIYNSESLKNWHILSGDYSGDCPERVCICNIELLHSNIDNIIPS